ncbi:MAG: ABC transporter permease [Clostridiales bacterium]|nr:ABC transporter permease [Clostridiales bacterium]
MKGIISVVLKKYTVIVILVALMIAFSLSSPYFLTSENLLKIVTQNNYYIIVALGVLFVMLGGGIDFSVGYQMSLVGTIMAILMVQNNVAIVPAILVGLACGVVLGILNGLIIVKLRLFPLIVTLATSMVFQGLSFTISQSQTFRGYPDAFRQITLGSVFGISYDTILTLVLILITSFILKRTYFGRHIMATGGNEEAARLSGIKTGRLKIVLYSICGLLTAIGTVVMLSKSNTHNSTFGPGTEFTGLTAGLIGGISFKGGEGSTWGLVAGVFVLAVLGNGMQLCGVSTFIQYIIKGAILIAAMAFDEYQKRARVKVRLEDVASPAEAGSAT